MRVLIHTVAGIRDSDTGEHVDRFLALFLSRQRSSILDIDHLLADGQNWSLRCHRILKHHRNLFTPNRAELAFAHCQDIAALEFNFPGADIGVVRQKPHNRRRDRAFA